MGGLSPEFIDKVIQNPGLGQGLLLRHQAKQKEAELAQQQKQFESTEALKRELGTTQPISPTGEKIGAPILGRTTTLPVISSKGKETPVQKIEVQFEKVKNLMRSLFERKTESLAETKGAGIIKGTLGQIAGAAKIKGFESTAAYEGQRTETALALNSILTGQNRVIKSIVDKILNTLPDVRDPDSYTKAKIKQSLINSYGIVRAVQQAGIDFNQYTDEALADPNSNVNRQIIALSPKPLSIQEKKDIDKLVNSIFGTGPSGVNAKDKDGWQTINGIRIRRKGR